MPDRLRLRRALLLGLVLGPLVASSHACGDDDATSSSSTVDTSDGAGLPGDIVALDLSVGTSDSPSFDGTSPDDSGAPDDAAPPAEGAFGAPCVDNDSCLSGYCVESDQGPVCSRTCTEDCPGGWSCLGISGGTDVTFLCFPRQDRLCRPCALDGQCGLGLCAPLAEGNRCSTPCDDDGACPDGYVCEDLESQFTPGNASRQCVPDNGACDCVPGKEGFVELCQKQNAFGTCSGLRTCLGAAGWGPCDAPEAAPETCDGLDQNCNGLADENLTGETCVIANEHGRCTGLRVCEAADGQTCVGLTPAPEACNYLDDDCDGDVDEGFRVDGRYSGVNQCGNCFTDCAAIFTRPNAFGVCDASSATPACRMACQPGFFDLNAVPGDGCELALDAGAIYVGRDSPGAAGGACGLGPVGTGDGHFPCRTIADGLARAAATGRKTILVADGLYGEAVTVPNGVSLLGGFRADTWERHLASTATILRGPEGSGDRVVVTAADITAPTVIEGFVIQAANASTPGANSVGVALRNATGALRLTGNLIFAGLGAPGAPGTPGASGQNGVAGSPGVGTKNLTTCTTSPNSPGGAGGVRACQNPEGGGTATVSGGKGGDAVCPDEDIQEGSGAAGGNAGGSGGPGGWGHASSTSGCNPTNGKPEVGTPGGDAAVKATSDGVGGGGCAASLGALVSGVWRGNAGTAGAHGEHGSGGGGGGAGSGGRLTTSFDIAGSGGGGGSGGCAGARGNAGAGGGASLGVFIVWTGAGPATVGDVPQVTGNVIVRNQGGPGGSGGNGGAGGDPGPGGLGGPLVTAPLKSPVFCVFGGAKGGFGSRGGHGGGGGGGCGGVSFDILAWGLKGARPDFSANTFPVDATPTGGAGGVGGNSSNTARGGTVGAAGLSGTIRLVD